MSKCYFVLQEHDHERSLLRLWVETSHFYFVSLFIYPGKLGKISCLFVNEAIKIIITYYMNNHFDNPYNNSDIAFEKRYLDVPFLFRF